MQLDLNDPSRWSYVSDQVMGGVSQGQATFEPGAILRLNGQVSTANRGGFIQARTALNTPIPTTAKGVVLNVRGNGQPYFIHLRTTRTLLPWQFYQGTFDTTQSWQEIRIPFAAFVANGGLLRTGFAPETLRSLAVVAYGRDHTADLSVRAVGFY